MSADGEGDLVAYRQPGDRAGRGGTPLRAADPADLEVVDRRTIGRTGLPGDLGNVAITQAVIAISRSFGMQVVAEGVETQGQLDFLRSLGCDTVQGYLTGRPQPAAQLAERLQALPQNPPLTLAA